jgi:hypothetical protein
MPTVYVNGFKIEGRAYSLGKNDPTPIVEITGPSTSAPVDIDAYVYRDELLINVGQYVGPDDDIADVPLEIGIPCPVLFAAFQMYNELVKLNG